MSVRANKAHATAWMLGRSNISFTKNLLAQHFQTHPSKSQGLLKIQTSSRPQLKMDGNGPVYSLSSLPLETSPSVFLSPFLSTFWVSALRITHKIMLKYLGTVEGISRPFEMLTY